MISLGRFRIGTEWTGFLSRSSAGETGDAEFRVKSKNARLSL